MNSPQTSDTGTISDMRRSSKISLCSTTGIGSIALAHHAVGCHVHDVKWPFRRSLPALHRAKSTTQSSSRSFPKDCLFVFELRPGTPREEIASRRLIAGENSSAHEAHSFHIPAGCDHRCSCSGGFFEIPPSAHRMAEALRSADYLWLVPGVLSLGCAFLLQTERWRRLARRSGHPSGMVEDLSGLFDRRVLQPLPPRRDRRRHREDLLCDAGDRIEENRCAAERACRPHGRHAGSGDASLSFSVRCDWTLLLADPLTRALLTALALHHGRIAGRDRFRLLRGSLPPCA